MIKKPGPTKRTPEAYFRHYVGLVRKALRIARRRKRRLFRGELIMRSKRANLLLCEILVENRGALVTRLGTTEASAILYFKEHHRQGECHFPDSLHTAMRTNSGFFPSSDALLSKFCRESLELFETIDVLGVRANAMERPFWGLESETFADVANIPKFVDIEDLMPMGRPYSWTRNLSGKKVLVVHPFETSIRSQYMRHELLFPDSDFLPEFELDVLRAEQTAGDNQGSSNFANWFESLESMKSDLQSREFDVALIGAGAYGMFLASECKRLGKTAIHIGGATQLLFGIYGRRWTEESSGSSQNIRPLINSHWVTALPEERPANERSVEGGGYWA
jgi:hypothetical protein